MLSLKRYSVKLKKKATFRIILSFVLSGIKEKYTFIFTFIWKSCIHNIYLIKVIIIGSGDSGRGGNKTFHWILNFLTEILSTKNVNNFWKTTLQGNNEVGWIYGSQDYFFFLNSSMNQKLSGKRKSKKNVLFHLPRMWIVIL